MKVGAVEVDEAKLGAFCKRWGIQRLEAFGSVLRSDFQSGSDVDLLVTFGPNPNPALSKMDDAERELSKLFGRKVDLVIKDRLKWVLRDRVLAEARPVYAV